MRGLHRRIGWSGDTYCCYFWFVGLDCLSLGLHICLSAPNVELHIPFGFIRIGRKDQNLIWVGRQKPKNFDSFFTYRRK